MATLFIPEDQRPALAKIARFGQDEAVRFTEALATAPADLDLDELAAFITERAGVIPRGTDVEGICETLREIAVVRELAEVPLEVFIDDVAEAMGEIEEDGLRLSKSEQGLLETRLPPMLQSNNIAVQSKARSLLHDRENSFCTARILTDIRPVFGSDVRDDPVAAIVAHTLRLTYHRGQSRRLQDIFITLRPNDLEALAELIERAKTKGETLSAFVGKSGLRRID